MIRVMSCPACGATVGPEARFCAQCGTSLTGMCPQCGAATPPKASFCADCGRPLHSETALSFTSQRRALPAEDAAPSGPVAERRLVSVLFADLVGFSMLSRKTEPQEMVTLLNEVFSHFDRLVERHGLEKIKTIGDSYMLVGGLPLPRADHAAAVAEMALDMIEDVARINEQSQRQISIRIGINTGPVVAGVIGRKKFTYDLWGDTVNLASRMESGGLPDSIQVTRPVYEKLKDQFVFEPRGEIEVKGKGSVEAWLLRL